MPSACIHLNMDVGLRERGRGGSIRARFAATASRAARESIANCYSKGRCEKENGRFVMMVTGRDQKCVR